MSALLDRLLPQPEARPVALWGCGFRRSNAGIEPPPAKSIQADRRRA
ncbi:MAG TPA: hypothetical protein VF528_14435 [Pyrinomonadaceae bacterium]